MVNAQTITALLALIKKFFEIIGVGIITIGSAYALVRYVLDSFHKTIPSHLRYNRFRFILARSTIAGLELIVVADVINTVNEQDYRDLGIVMLIVLLRTILNYTLTKDVEAISPNDRKILEAH